MLKYITFLFLFLHAININATSDTLTVDLEEGKRLLLKDEKFIEALRFFTEAIKTATKNKQNDAVAENMYWIAECLFQVRQLKELAEVLEDGESFMLRNRQNSSYCNLMLIKAKYLIDIGKIKDANRLLSKLEKENNSPSFIIKIKLLQADAYYKISDLEKSKSLYDFIIRNTKDSIQIAQAYNGIGSYYYMVSDFENAEEYYNRALKIYKIIFNICHTKTIQIKYNLGLIAGKTGDYRTSEINFIESLKIYHKKFGEYHPKTAEAYSVLGGVYMNQDNFEKAILYFKKDKSIIEKLYGKNHPDNIYNYLNIGTSYYYLNNLSNAEVQLRSAVSSSIKFYSKYHNLFSQAVIELSRILTLQEKYNESEKLLKEVIEINKKNLNDYIPDAYLQLGCNYFAQQKFDKAITFFHQANKMYIQFYGDKNIYSIDPLTEISNTYLQKNDWLKALEYANLALDQTLENNKIIYPYDHWQSVLQILKCKKEMYNHGLISLQNSKNDIELIKKTIKEANAIKQTYYSSGSQLYYAEKITELNEIGIYYLTHFYKKTDTYFLDNLLSFAENNKANLLRHKISSSASNEILPKKERSKLSAITNKLNHFITLNEDQEETTYDLNDSILFYQNLHEEFTKIIEKNYPKVYAVKYGQKSFTTQQIQQELKKNFSFLMYCNDAENYYCLSISKNSIHFRICGNKYKIDSITQLYQSKIIDKRFDKKLNIQLSQILLPRNLKENLIISPDASIQNISFDALFQNQTSKYLIYNHSIQYTFSSGSYFKHQTTAENKNIVAFFPDFSNTKYAVLNSKKEQTSLNAFPNCKSYNDSNATKKSFLHFFKTAKLVHIASHLIADTILPLESSLLFQPNDDWFLTINDIWKLNTNAQLVTLAACQSNYGKSQNGEGMQNFAWAFQYAGAHNILSTQWNASDKSTANIISSFYKNLQDGKPKEDALRHAKIDYIENTDAIGAQPFFWANYSLITDDSEINISGGLFQKALAFVSTHLNTIL